MTVQQTALLSHMGCWIQMYGITRDLSSKWKNAVTRNEGQNILRGGKISEVCIIMNMSSVSLNDHREVSRIGISCVITFGYLKCMKELVLN